MTKTAFLVGLLSLPESNDLTEVAVKQENGSTLTELYRVLDCRTVDVIRLTDSIDLWVDDEALLVADPVPNRLLSMMMIAFGRGGEDHIMGRGLFLSADESTGATLSLNEKQLGIVTNAYEQALRM